MMKLPKLTPSTYFLMTLALSIVVSLLLPWKISNTIESESLRYTGIGILIISFGLNTLAYSAFQKNITPHAPFSTPKILIQGGIFSLTRNPVYIALVLVQIGLASVFNTVWMLLTAVILFGLLHFFIVKDEEKTLEKYFKEEYQHYKKKTRRWL